MTKETLTEANLIESGTKRLYQLIDYIKENSSKEVREYIYILKSEFPELFELAVSEAMRILTARIAENEDALGKL